MAVMKENNFGRFEQSFMFHMIRDFFLLLIVVAGLELGIRYWQLSTTLKSMNPSELSVLLSNWLMMSNRSC